MRTRLARLHGEIEQARQLAEQGLQGGLESANQSLLLLELGHLALHAGDMAQAGAHIRGGFQHLLQQGRAMTFIQIFAMMQEAS
jgi:hypothetical protein